VVPEKARRKASDLAGTENDKIYSRGPIELSKAETQESTVESADDHLEKKISSILTTIPAKIHLSSEVEIESPPNGGSSPPKSYATVSPGVRPLRATSASPSFTLAPAYAKNPRPRAKGGNPDIKLYHLHRSSGEAPIKLFVRLVGENGERVMVRVGGGWADLGEYLKEYATHHGRRSASDGRIEIQDIPKLNSKSSIASLRAQAAGRSTPTGRPDSAMSRPGSSLAFARTRTSEGSPVENRTPTTPKFVSARRQELTPPSGSSSVSSIRSSSRLSWTGTEEEPALGLAGPKSKKVDISPEKQAWVEGMLGQVRKASAQKKEEADFGSLGKIGATKRIFRRGSKGSAGDLI
jgi:Growth-Arrest-Specific Protein 2 Domain